MQLGEARASRHRGRGKKRAGETTRRRSVGGGSSGWKSALTFVGSEHRDGLGGRGGGGGHDDDGDVLLEGEGARVEERPELAARGVREDGGPGATHEEGDDLEEELRDVDGLRAEVEDLAEDGGEGGQADTCGAYLVVSGASTQVIRVSAYRGSTCGRCGWPWWGRPRARYNGWQCPRRSVEAGRFHGRGRWFRG